MSEIETSTTYPPCDQRVIEAMCAGREAARRAAENNPAEAAYFNGAEKAYEHALKVVLGESSAARPRVAAVEASADRISALVVALRGIVVGVDDAICHLGAAERGGHPFATRLMHVAEDINSVLSQQEFSLGL